MTTMIYKLETLNRYLENGKKRLEKDIVYWEEQIEEFGEDEVIMSHTYGETLNIVKKQLDFKLKELEENYRLIEMLTETIEMDVI